METPLSGHSVQSSPFRHVAAAVLLIVAAVLIAGSFWEERFSLPVVALAVIAAVLSVISGRWWPAHRRVILTLAVDGMLIFTYLWALDERLPIEIQVTNNGYVANIGGNIVAARTPVHAGRVALLAEDFTSYRVQTTGEAQFPFDGGLLGQIGQLIRFAAPQPGWGNIRLQVAGRATTLGPPVYSLSGHFSRDIRGEWESSGGAAAFAPVLRPPYTISGDFMRPDGAQGFLISLDSRGRAAYLQVRMDRPDVYWIHWSGGQAGVGMSGTALHPQVLPMVQRNLRLVLGNVIGGFVLCGAALLFFVLVSSILATVRSRDEIAILERWLDARGVVATMVAIAAAAGFVATALVADKLLGRIPHVQDDVAYLFQAKTVALGRLWTPVPALPGFFHQDFINLYHGRWFGKYPPGWPIVLAIGVRLGAAWLVNPMLAAIDLVLIYQLGREVYGRTLGLVAALITLSSPFFLFLSGSYMAHTSTLAYLAGFALLLLRWVRRVERGNREHETWYLAGAGFLLGMGFITRELDAVAFAAPFVLLIWSRSVRSRVAPAILWLILGGIVPVASMAAYNWDLTGHVFTTPYAVWSPFDRLGFGPSTLYSHTPGDGFQNMSQNLQMLLADLFGWPYYLTLALALLPFITGRANRWDALFGLSTLTVMGAYVFYWGSGIMYGPRYYFVTIPWLALLSARGLEELYHLPGRVPWFRRDRTTAMMFCLLLASALLLYNTLFYLPTNIPIYRGYNYVSAAPVERIQAAGIHHALIFTVSDPVWAWWPYGAVFSSNAPRLNGDIVYARDQGNADPKLMHLYPGRQYYRLNGISLSLIQP